MDVGQDAGGPGEAELIAVGDQVSLPGLGQDVGAQQPAWRGEGSVVEALAPAGLVSVPPDELAGGSLGELSLTLTRSQKRPRTSRSSPVS